MSRGLALTSAQIDDLRAVATLLPTTILRERFTEMLSAALRARDSIGDGELSRLSRAIASELLALHDRKTARPQSDQQPKSAIRGYGVSI